MKDTKTSKYAVVSGILPLLLSLVIFTGTTWAWFADRVENTGNVVKTGSLDVKMYWSDSRWDLAASDNVLYAETDWKDVEEEGHAVIFDCQNWYPGCEDVKYLKIVNTGSLPFRYTLNILSDGERKAESEALEDIAHMGNSSHMENIANPAEVVDVYWILYEEMPETGFSWESAQKALLSDFLKENVPRALTEGILAAENDEKEEQAYEVIIGIALKMRDTAGMEYQNLSMERGFYVQLNAAQILDEVERTEERLLE